MSENEKIKDVVFYEKIAYGYYSVHKKNGKFARIMK